MEWSEFARRLGRELAGLERDTILIVRERDESRHYVQAMREPDRLYAEAVSNNFLDGPLLLTPADEEVMSEVGWRPPADPAPRNWWTELPAAGTPGGMLAVTLADHARLAEVMVTALRDVQGVRRPSDLVYESFHRHGTGLIELVDFGIETADPSRVARRRSSIEALGADAAAAPPAAGPPSTGPIPTGPVRAGSLPAGTPPAGTPMPLPPDGAPATEADLLEPRLAEAKHRGDHATYFSLLGSADLVLPATGHAVEDPDRAELPTITIGSGTYVPVFTSPGTLARAGDAHPGLYRRTSFALLAAGWPDPEWQLAINPGLPSEVHLDASAIVRLDGAQRAPSPNPTPEAGNPYGAVDPNALSGPNPIAGGAIHAANGSLSAGNGVPYANDAHTAIDSYTVADLQAALESGGVTPPQTPVAPSQPVQPPAQASPPPAQPPAQPPPPVQNPETQPPPLAQPPAQALPREQTPDSGQGHSERDHSEQGPSQERPLPPSQAEPPARPQPQPQRPAQMRPQPPAAQPLAGAGAADQSPSVRAQPAPPARPPAPATPPAQARPAVPTAPPPASSSPVAAPPSPPHGPSSVQAPEGELAPLGAPTGHDSDLDRPSGVSMQPPHGTRLWQTTGEGEETPLAVYDAVGGMWTPVRSATPRIPRAE